MYLGFTVPEGRLYGALPMRMRGMLYDQLPLLPDGDQIQVRNPTDGVPGIHGSISYLKLTFYVRSFSSYLFQADSGVRLGISLDLILLGPGLIL